MPKFVLIFLSTFLLLAVGCEHEKSTNEKPNIILMVGDGMGVAQVTAANYWNPQKSNYYNFKTVGLMETSSTSHKVTDSASGATAMSTGEKTYKRAIGVASDSTHLKTILEELHDQGYQTGLISLTSITHATPASFYAHVTDRDMHEEIASQLVDADLDFFAGGGWKYFLERKDNRNLFHELGEKGYEMDSLALPSKLDGSKKYGSLIAEGSLPSKVQGRVDFLQRAASSAIEYFKKSDKPYFLMVEGSYIDWGGHAEDAEMMIQESVDFDHTIGTVMDKTKTDDNTLLVVTADHETGGVAIGKYYEEDEVGNRIEVPDTLGIQFNTDQHTASMVPVFAKGYKEELFSGVYANNQIYHKLMEVCKLPD
ncbi:alkaline phosphatase [Fodinibius salsisoli]|uniref:Alkaline phosphatase n=1 Tax=Fodinibius salsisoli TaxID=2820877 RepID=A0ABT3PI08_9BACT|nr:alkaline phosphatase [Fodinibius salsisoli]MCW9705418.1 alkaline phosphatase [Fodinibius salsisoli]